MKLMTELKGFLTGHTPNYLAGKPKSENSIDKMLSNCCGFAVVVDGIINIDTVSSTQQLAIRKAITLKGYLVLGGCDKAKCDCHIKFLNDVIPDAEIVEVFVGY